MPYTVQDVPLFLPFKDDGVTNRAEHDTVMLNTAYEVPGYPDFYFVIRADKSAPGKWNHRVNLYQRGVVDPYLRGNNDPFDRWESNEQRCNRDLSHMTADMQNKAEVISIRVR